MKEYKGVWVCGWYLLPELLSPAPTPIFPSAYIQETGQCVGERLPYIHKSLLIFGNTSPPDPRVQGIVVLHLDFGVSKFGPRTWRKLRAEESTDLH